MTEGSRSVDIIFLHIVLHIFLLIFLQIFTSLLLALEISILIILIFSPYFTILLLYLHNDFLTLNFGQLLHLLDNELKNIIRNFEKQKKQIISAQYGILFNQTYIYIYIYVCVRVSLRNFTSKVILMFFPILLLVKHYPMSIITGTLLIIELLQSI